MSTVFKLKAALLMACAFVVVSVSTAWGQGLTPVTSDNVAFDFDGGTVNWVVRGDKANGEKINDPIGLKFGFGGQQQYAIFTLADGFLSDDVKIYNNDVEKFYLNKVYQYDAGNVPDNFGYDGNFKPDKVANKTMTKIPLKDGMNNYVIRDIQYTDNFQNAETNSKCAVYKRKNLDIHNV
ncbi:MAG: hypothetical protein J6U21_02175, partial [Bacteroidales bacterium]|nr:hypothetical protein [Bacteroidales bacterium]